ncbi:hypothetical protein CERSUDRAFT_87599 [Gelatoporia subvermispora B]|uniref:TEA domain-containing protein n=1 Tax=Ceriporiopsis subvermispora (strain B) TaxID=914234 RepID=M2PBD1_CERS8|nr:hypothetical protein CERSUDRAFT_87599 [Gelatoporia subvermispora B]
MPRKNERAWPPVLESALKEALKKYSGRDHSLHNSEQPQSATQGQLISDYIYETTGQRKTVEEIDGRLQQLYDNSGN